MYFLAALVLVCVDVIVMQFKRVVFNTQFCMYSYDCTVRIVQL